MKKILLTLGLAAGLALSAKAQIYGLQPVLVSTALPSNSVPAAVGATAGTLSPTNSGGAKFMLDLTRVRDYALQATVDYPTAGTGSSNLVFYFCANLDGSTNSWNTNYWNWTITPLAVTTHQVFVLETNNLGLGYLILDYVANKQTNAPLVTLQASPVMKR